MTGGKGFGHRNEQEKTFNQDAQARWEAIRAELAQSAPEQKLRNLFQTEEKDESRHAEEQNIAKKNKDGTPLVQPDDLKRKFYTED